MPGVTHELPAWLEPVLAFVNSVDVETGVDELAPDPTALSAWLLKKDLVGAAVPATRAEYRLALDLRQGLRCLALMNNGGPADEPALLRMRAALDRLPLTADFAGGDGDPPGLRPLGLPPVRAALGRIAAGYAQSVGTGDWTRIRRCPAEDCAWAFWDSSAKGTRRWCTMRVCGNRAKARAFAQRRART